MAETYIHRWRNNKDDVLIEDSIKGHNPTIRFILDDETEVHITISSQGDCLEVRSTGPRSSGLVIEPKVSNSIRIKTNPHY